MTYGDVLARATKDKRLAFEVAANDLTHAYIFTVEDLHDLICLEGNIARDGAILVTIHQTIKFKLKVGSGLKNGTDEIVKEESSLIQTLSLGVGTANDLAKRLKIYIDSGIDSDGSKISR